MPSAAAAAEYDVTLLVRRGKKNDISCQAEKTRARIGRRGKKKQTRKKKQKTFSEKGIGITKFNFGERGKREARQKKKS